MVNILYNFEYTLFLFVDVPQSVLQWQLWFFAQGGAILFRIYMVKISRKPYPLCAPLNGTTVVLNVQ